MIERFQIKPSVCCPDMKIRCEGCDSDYAYVALRTLVKDLLVIIGRLKDHLLKRRELIKADIQGVPVRDHYFCRKCWDMLDHHDICFTCGRCVGCCQCDLEVEDDLKEWLKQEPGPIVHTLPDGRLVTFMELAELYLEVESVLLKQSKKHKNAKIDLTQVFHGKTVRIATLEKELEDKEGCRKHYEDSYLRMRRQRDLAKDDHATSKKAVETLAVMLQGSLPDGLVVCSKYCAVFDKKRERRCPICKGPPLEM